jgi:hypothetical protein
LTTYTYTGAVAYDRLGSSWRTAAGLRSVSVTDPATGLLPANLVQGGRAATWLTADANSRYSFTCDVPGVVVDFGAGAEALYANEVPGLVVNFGAATDTAVATLVGDPASATRTALSSTYGRKGASTDAVLYVSPTGSNTDDGLSPGAAKATIAAAANALPSSGGTVNIAAGVYSLANDPLPNRGGITYRGAGREATRFNVTAGSFLAPTTTSLHGLVFEGLTVVGYADHLFNFTVSGGIYQSKFKDCTLVSASAAASVFCLRGTGSFQEVMVENCILDRLSTATVPTVDIIDQMGAANANVFSHLTMHSANCTSSPAIRFEAATDATYTNDNHFMDVVGEQNPGGLIHIYSARGTLIQDCHDWDATVAYVGDVLRVGKSATNALISYDTVAINSGRRGGTLGAGVYDYSGPSLVSNNSTLINVGNSTNIPVINAGGVVTDITGLHISSSLTVSSTASPNISMKPAYASSDGLLLQDGVAGYTSSLLAFRTFTSTVNRATINGAGTISWGTGGAAIDTTLYRAGAGVLQAGQKLTAIGGLGVGNSAAATTPGTVVKKIEIFDAAGVSLGFIPVYSTIT